MSRQPEKSRSPTILTETPVGLITFALGAEAGSVGTTIVAFIPTTVTVTVGSCVGKTGLGKILLVRAVGFGPARSGLVGFSLGGRMDLRIERRMLWESRLMLGLSRGCFD